MLPSEVGFYELLVTLGDLDSADMLIGMDIINQGNFAVTNSSNGTKFSFRIPSQADTTCLKLIGCRDAASRNAVAFPLPSVPPRR